MVGANLLLQHGDALLELLPAVVAGLLLEQLLPVDLVLLALGVRLEVDLLQVVQRLDLLDRPAVPKPSEV